MQPTPTTFVLFFGLLAYASELVASDGPPRKYEIFAAADKSRWIQVSQLETIFHSIDDMLQGLNKKQQEDAISIGQVSNDLQAINQRLQGIESQISLIQQTETFNTHRFGQFVHNTIQGEIQIEEVKRKLEKNAQQMETRLNEIDSSLERLHTVQGDLRKEIRKVNTAQNTLETSVGELTENSKIEASRLMQTLNSSQHQLCQEFTVAIQNLSDSKDEYNVMKIRDSNGNERNLKPNQDNTIPSQLLLTSISTLNGSYNRLHEQTQTVDVSVKECVSAANKIYERIEETKQNTESSISNFTGLIDDIMMKNEAALNQMEMKISSSLDSILGEQQDFKTNCKRLQEREQQLEDMAVTILRKIFNYIKNSTEVLRTDLERVANYKPFRRSQRTDDLENVYRILGVDNERETKTTAEPTKNSLLELHSSTTESFQKPTGDAQPTTDTNIENKNGSSGQENFMNMHSRDSAVDESTIPATGIIRRPERTRRRKISSIADLESVEAYSNSENSW